MSGSDRSTSVLEIALVDRGSEEPEVERAVEELRDLGGREQLAAEVEHDAGQLPAQGGGERRQHRVGRGAGEPDREAPVLAARGAARVVDRGSRPRPGSRGARSSSTSPAGASSTLRVVRYRSGSPSSASKRRICCESGGCAMCSRCGGAAEMPLLGDGDEVAQMPELHGSASPIHI